MSVSLCIGQCGCQIGGRFVARIKKNTEIQPPSVLIDTEPKVVRAHEHICAEALVDECQKGSGNNWANGYNRFHSKNEEDWEKLSYRSMEAVRRQAERCDIYKGCMLFSSIGGGTGSGLGCRLAEELRDTYSKEFLISCCIAPSDVGETPLQYYNSSLSLSKLNSTVDSIVLIQNKEIADIFSPSISTNSSSSSAIHLKKTNEQREAAFHSLPNQPVSNSYGSINDYIVNSLVDTFIHTESYPSPVLHCNKIRKEIDLASFVNRMTPLPSTKFVEIWTSAGLPTKTTTSSSSSLNTELEWKQITKSLLRAIPKSKLNNHNHNNNANVLYCDTIVRGDEKNTFKLSNKYETTFELVEYNKPDGHHLLASILPSLSKSTSYNNKPMKRMGNSKKPQKSMNINQSICVALNRSRVNEYLLRTLKKASTMYATKAYLHWYYKAHCTDDDFIESFEGIRNIIDDYTLMTR